MPDDDISSSEITLNMVTELLKVQENNFKTFVTTLMNNFESRLAVVSRDIQDLKSSLEFSQSEIEVLKANDAKQAEIGKDLKTLKDQITEMEDKLDYLENQSRRNNIRISGIDEDAHESWADTKEKVKNLLSDKLDLDVEDMPIERAHRTGKHHHDKPRQIVAKLLDYSDRELIMQASKRLKGTGIYINEDLSSRVIQRRKAQREKMLQARKDGLIAYFSLDHLIIKPKAQHSSSLQPFGVLGAQAAIADQTFNFDDHH